MFPISWWEPGTSGALDIGDVSAILFFLITLATVFMGVSKYWMKKLKQVISHEITTATAPIQPNANGGLSLPDVARRLEKVETVLDEVQLQNLETRDIILQVLVDKEIKTKRPRVNKSA
jgi:hypothetical protein